MTLTPRQIAQFDEDGFLVLENILTPEQVTKALSAVRRLFRGEIASDRRPSEYRKPLAPRPENAATNHMVHGRLLDNDLWEIATDARLGEMAATLLKTPSLSLMEDQLIEKSPGGSPLAMHQDPPYITHLRNWDVINLWTALVDITPQMAPLVVLRGSHRWPVAAMPSKFVGGGEEDYMEVVADACPPGEKIEPVEVIVPAGGGAFFASLTMHGSPRNLSDRTRYAYTLHYAGAKAQVNANQWSGGYEPFMVEGIGDGDRPVSPFMPIVYPAVKP